MDQTPTIQPDVNQHTDAVAEFITAIKTHPWLVSLEDSPLRWLLPPFIHRNFPAEGAPPLLLAWADAENLLRVLIWYVILGWGLYALAVKTSGRRGGAKFLYALPLNETGAKLSLLGAVRYIFPKAIYTHASFRLDLLWYPFYELLRVMGVLGTTIGAGVAHAWLVSHFGAMRLGVPAGTPAIFLQAGIMLFARDFARFMWHYQAHTVRFFWEFHKVHHTAEALHPLMGARAHPVDLILRNTYMGAGGGLIAGTLVYLLGMKFSASGAMLAVIAARVVSTVEYFEHTHIKLGFGKIFGSVFYSPYLHQFHHSAAPEHRNVNLGLAGGLKLWDWLFGTLYEPKRGETVTWGSSLEELGDNNPHKSVWDMLYKPFVAAFTRPAFRSLK